MRFDMGTKIVSGDGALEALKEFDAERVLVVCDPFFQENGWGQRVAEATGAARWEIFHKVAPDPTVTLAAEGTGVLKNLAPDLVVALGGGSAMDLAKAMVYFSGTGAALAAVPTTSGSGSEVTDFAILTHNSVKHPLVDGRLRPQMAVLEEKLLESLPKSLIADGGFDAICHALEAYVAMDAGAISDCLALEAFRRVMALLPASWGGDKSCRLRIHEASTMAGVAFSQAGLGLCHAVSHVLGGRFHVPHGRLNAILLPSVISCNAHAAGARYARMAQEAGMVGSAQTLGVRNLKNALVKLRRELNMPSSLREAGVDLRQLRSELDGLVKAVLEDPCCATNPIKVEPFMVRAVLEEAAGRG